MVKKIQSLDLYLLEIKNKNCNNQDLRLRGEFLIKTRPQDELKNEKISNASFIRSHLAKNAFIRVYWFRYFMLLKKIEKKFILKIFIFVARIRSKIKKTAPAKKRRTNSEFALNVDISGYFARAKMSEMSTFRSFSLLKDTPVYENIYFLLKK